MKRKTIVVIILMIMLVACQPGTVTPAITETPTATPTLAMPEVQRTSVPDVQSFVAQYFTSWKGEAYEAMYALLSSEVQATLSAEAFKEKHIIAMRQLTFDSLDIVMQNEVTTPTSSTVYYQIKYMTNGFGEIIRDTTMSLVLENGQWRIAWDDGMILPELRGGNQLALTIKPVKRGNIYDRNGRILAGEDQVVPLSMTVGSVNENTMSYFSETIANLTGLRRDQVMEMYEKSKTAPGWVLPLGELSSDQADRNSYVFNLGGVTGALPYLSRYYYDGGIAPETIGYVGTITAETVDTYLRRGYQLGDLVGWGGIEYSFESVLAGKHDLTLYVKDPQGQPISQIGHADSVQPQSITTTIDSRLQFLLQKSMPDLKGAIVVMEVDTGNVIAMVSNPGINPNWLNGNNPNRYLRYSDNIDINTMLDQVIGVDDYNNYATSGTFPLGSVFKIITMAAALETGTYTQYDQLDCQHQWTSIEGKTYDDWTLVRERPPSGVLSLPEGLMRSCNPWFYEIGQTLYTTGQVTAVADMARAFGLGDITGIGIDEQPGDIHNPASLDEAIMQAIGQMLTVSPIQVARFVAAVANGGTLYQPNLFFALGPEGSDPTWTFSDPQVAGTLPVSAENLKIISDAMVTVIKDPRGTAYGPVGGMPYAAAGKTGTAQTGGYDDTAWFAGYTMLNRTDKPDIVVVVVLEDAGDGSVMGAPIFRRAVSLYFSDNQNFGRLMPWESAPYMHELETE